MMWSPDLALLTWFEVSKQPSEVASISALPSSVRSVAMQMEGRGSFAGGVTGRQTICCELLSSTHGVTRVILKSE